MGLAAAHVLGGEWGVFIFHTGLVLLWGFGGCDDFVLIPKTLRFTGAFHLCRDVSKWGIKNDNHPNSGIFGVPGCRYDRV